MMKAYLDPRNGMLLINPEHLIPTEQIGNVKTIDTDIEAPNGRPIVDYRGEDVEIHITSASYADGKAKVIGRMGIINNGRVDRKTSDTEATVMLDRYPLIKQLYENLLQMEQ